MDPTSSAALGISGIILLAIVALICGEAIFSNMRAREFGRKNWSQIVDNLQEQLDNQLNTIKELEENNGSLSQKVTALEASDKARDNEINRLKTLVDTQNTQIVKLSNLLNKALKHIKAFIDCVLPDGDSRGYWPYCGGA
ncbi:hypothetical protein [Lawsonella sp.]|uniref:hypothetical protein n=1 Tax=Lawsonella sp. TaxID=2041415 RepID=UPI0025C62BE7|nr:hypothetical protein [Lawsonella sp.]